MARIDSKTNWVPTDRPVPVDFNRIENNNEQAFNEIDQEKVDRAAAINQEVVDRDAAISVESSNRTIAINAEANARIAGDNNLQSNINAEANARIAADNVLQANKISKDFINRTYTSGTLNLGQAYIIPSGVYYYTISGNGSTLLSIRDNTDTPRTFGGVGDNGILISDGVNAYFACFSGNSTWALLKIS